VVAASATAYTVVKVAGAAYVVWLGVQAIRHRADARTALLAGERTPERPGQSLRTGFLVGVSNPKTIVFFVAFLPQFTDPGAAALPQVLALGVAFAALAVVSDSVWATVAGSARRWFAREPKRLDAMGAAGGVMMIGLGATLAATE
jgi:threonine/homoserine/homoserine lactone efflux protein